MATLWGVPYYETSAKVNINVNAVFLVSSFKQVAQYHIGFQFHVTRDSGRTLSSIRISFGKCANITLLVQNDSSL